MADSISFTCPECSKAYKVAAEYAGRSFNCKQCGYALTVPALVAEPQVEMGSGTAVMRKTDSGRVVQVNPTQVFVKQRESEVVAPPPPKSKTPLLIAAGAVALVLLVVVVAVAFGALSGKEGPGASGNDPVADTKSNEPVKPQISKRQDILNRLGAPGLRLKDFIGLYRQGTEAKLDSGDIAELAEAVSRAAWDEMGGDLGDDELMALAAELKGVRNNVPADTLRRVVVERHLGKNPKPAAWEKAQRELGREPYDFSTQIQRATTLHDTGIVQGADKLGDELKVIQGRSVDGWVLKEELTRLREIETSLDALSTEFERIKREDPFRLVAQRVKSEISKELFYGRHTWQMVAGAPVVVFIEQRRNDTESVVQTEGARAHKMVKALLEWYAANMAQGRPRSVPTAVTDQAQRDAEPWVILLFASLDSWRSYLSDNRSLIDTNAVKHFLDHPRGRLSLVYTGDDAEMRELQHGAGRLAIDSFHPDAPKVLDERGDFKRLQSFVLGRYLAACIANVDDPEAPQAFMTSAEGQGRMPGMYRSLLERWRQPFNRDQRGINSFGGPAMKAADILAMKSMADTAEIFERNCKNYEWPEGQLDGVLQNVRARESQQTALAQPYCMALLLFLYNHEAGGKPAYREKLLAFVKADIEGKVTLDNQLEVFTETFGLDQQGWATLEREFVDFQTK